MKITFNVAGMHCQSCVNTITKKLSSIQGVEAVDIQLPLGTAVVEFDQNNVSSETLLEAIDALGFEVSLL